MKLVDSRDFFPRPNERDEARQPFLGGVCANRCDAEGTANRYRDLRIENSLTGEHGDDVRLKTGAHVEVTVTAEPKRYRTNPRCIQRAGADAASDSTVGAIRRNGLGTRDPSLRRPGMKPGRGM